MPPEFRPARLRYPEEPGRPLTLFSAYRPCLCAQSIRANTYAAVLGGSAADYQPCHSVVKPMLRAIRSQRGEPREKTGPDHPAARTRGGRPRRGVPRTNTRTANSRSSVAHTQFDPQNCPWATRGLLSTARRPWVKVFRRVELRCECRQQGESRELRWNAVNGRNRRTRVTRCRSRASLRPTVPEHTPNKSRAAFFLLGVANPAPLPLGESGTNSPAGNLTASARM
jgi:hypothetical protein